METVGMAALGVEDYTRGSTSARRLAGIWNVVVWGRAVTNVLQRIRGFDPQGFDAWYAPRRAALEDSPDFKYLYELRSEILKEGLPIATTGSAQIRRLDTADLARIPRPANATSFFIGDRLGGSGWELELPDGTKERWYVELPSSVAATTWAQFAAATSRKSLPPPTAPIERVLTDYVSHLRSLVSEAEAEFGRK